MTSLIARATNNDNSFLIAIDGPSASGKGTIAQLLAQKYNLKHLETGLLYRIIACQLLEHDIKADDFTQVVNFASRLDFSKKDNVNYYTPEISEYTSKIAAYQEIRDLAFGVQKQFIIDNNRAVLDGRDITTVIAPDADLKLYITANIEIRAQRRFLQYQSNNINIDYKNILEDLKIRDQRDTSRQNSPLRDTKQALRIDSTDMSIEQVLEFIKQHIHSSSIYSI